MHTLIWFFPKLAAATFGVAGLIFFAGPEPLSRVLTDWGFGRNFNRVFGESLILAAAFLLTPQLRLWGMALAGIKMFGITVMLLDRRKYLDAVPGILLLGTLPFALAAS